MADIPHDPVLDPILARHKLTRRDLAHGNVCAEPVRTARREVIVALHKDRRPHSEIAALLNMAPSAVQAKLRKIERALGIPSAHPGQDTSKRLRARRLPTIEGPSMVDAPGERRACVSANACLTNLVKRRPSAQNASCPTDCAHFIQVSEELRVDDAVRRGPGFLF